MSQYPLHNFDRLSLRKQFAATGMAELVQRVARLATVSQAGSPDTFCHW